MTLIRECPICKKQAALEKHHITPLSYGGASNGPSIHICATCHRAIHAQAENFGNAKRRYYFTASDFERAKPFIVAILKAKAELKRSGAIAPDARNCVTLHLKKETLVRAHRAKVDAGFTSLEKWVIALIEREFRNTGA